MKTALQREPITMVGQQSWLESLSEKERRVRQKLVEVKDSYSVKWMMQRKNINPLKDSIRSYLDNRTWAATPLSTKLAILIIEWGKLIAALGIFVIVGIVMSPFNEPYTHQHSRWLAILLASTLIAGLSAFLAHSAKKYLVSPERAFLALSENLKQQLPQEARQILDDLISDNLVPITLSTNPFFLEQVRIKGVNILSSLVFQDFRDHRYYLEIWDNEN